MDWIFAEYNWRLGLWSKYGAITQSIPTDRIAKEPRDYINRIHAIHAEILLLNIHNNYTKETSNG